MLDLRIALRQLLKSPGFTTVAALSLALGIGANTVLFSLINAVLLQALPVSHPNELRVVNWVGQRATLSNFSGSNRKSRSGQKVSGSFPYPAYRDFRDQAPGFSDLFAFFPLERCRTVARGLATTHNGLMVSGNFFTGYGTRALLGRTLHPDDDRPGAPPAAVITHRLWEQVFGADPGVVGKPLTIQQFTCTVVGVLPPRFASPLPGNTEAFYVPFALQPHLAGSAPLDSFKHWWVQVMGRLNGEASEPQIETTMGVLFQRALALSDSRIEEPRILLERGRNGVPLLQERLALPALALQAAVALILFIACLNVAGLLLARGARRLPAMAVHAALGAGRRRLLRHALGESVILAGLGVVGGLLVAFWGQAAVMQFIQKVGPGLNITPRIDLPVLLFTLVVGVFTCLACGALPGLRFSRTDPAGVLRGGAGLKTPPLRLGRYLLIAQVGLSLLLIASAGFFLRTVVNLYRVDPGFRTDHLIVFRLDGSQAEYRGPALQDFYRRVRESVSGLPGVQSVALSHLALLSQNSSQSTYTIPGRPAGERDRLQVYELAVSEDYLGTMGISLQQGRDFAATDTPEGPRVILVNQALARALFPDGNALGQSLHSGDDPYRIIGVCADAKYDSLRREAPPTVYHAYTRDPSGAMYFSVRTVLPPESAMPAIRRAVATVDPLVPLTEMRTQRAIIDRSLVGEVLLTRLCLALAVIALFLCALGLHGAMAYNVARRTNEIGLRLALGATPGRVAQPVIREALVLAAWGLALGLPGAIALSEMLRSVLFGVPRFAPTTLLAATLAVLGIAVIAAWIPARRAARMDPLAALRTE